MSEKEKHRQLPVLQGVVPIVRSRVPTDVIAGVTLAALGIPEVMGYTTIAGMPVITGLYTILIPIAVFAVLGSSRHLVVGADSASAAIMAAGLAGLAPIASPQYVSIAGIVAIVDRCLPVAGSHRSPRVPRRLPVAERADRLPDRRRHPGGHGAGRGHVRRPGRQRWRARSRSSSRRSARSHPKRAGRRLAVSASVSRRDPGIEGRHRQDPRGTDRGDRRDRR